MQKKIFILLTVFILGAGMAAKSQAYEIQQLILDWEKLSQLKNILSDMYKGYEIVEKGYTAIRDISQGNFSLHKAFLDGLLAVSPAVRNYYKIAEIIQDQLEIVSEYKQAYSRFRQDKHFSPDELSYIANTYSALFDRSLKDLGTLTTILTDGQLRASDDERLKQIDALHANMQNRLSFLRSFNNNAELLSIQRSRGQDDIGQVKIFYGLE